MVSGSNLEALMAVRQVNLGKRLMMTNLNQRTSKNKFISLIQERNVSTARGQNKITGLDPQHSVYHTSDPHCRAAIYMLIGKFHFG